MADFTFVADPAGVGLPTPDFASSIQLPDVLTPVPGIGVPGIGVSPPAPAIGGGLLDSFQSLANAITGAAKTYYGTQAELAQAQAQAKIAQAQAGNAVRVAQTGQPSSYLLLWGGLGLAALLILGRK